MVKEIQSDLDKKLIQLRNSFDFQDSVWNPMEKFYRMHSHGECKAIESSLGIAVVSTWKENTDIPFLLSAYRIRDLNQTDLYLEAFLHVSKPNWSAVIALDKRGDLRFDAQERMLGDSPKYFHPVTIPNRYVSFLANLPAFQQELWRYIVIESK